MTVQLVAKLCILEINSKRCGGTGGNSTIEEVDLSATKNLQQKTTTHEVKLLPQERSRK